MLITELTFEIANDPQLIFAAIVWSAAILIAGIAIKKTLFSKN